MTDKPEDSYANLIDQSIDELHASGSVSGSGIEILKVKEARAKFRSDHPLFLSLFAVCFLSLGAYLYFSLTDANGALSYRDANLELKKAIVSAAITSDQQKMVKATQAFVSEVSVPVDSKHAVDRVLEKFADDLKRTGLALDVVSVLGKREVGDGGIVKFPAPASVATR